MARKKTLTLKELVSQLEEIMFKKEENKDLPVFVESTLEESFEELHEVKACPVGEVIPSTKGDPPEAFEDDSDSDDEDGPKSSFPFIKLVTWN